MANIENFISKVEAEVTVALQSGILPDAGKEKSVLERLYKKYPNLKVNPDNEQKIIMHAKLSLNADKN